VIESPSPGIRAFQLRILSGMRGNEDIVEQALRRLEADSAELETCRMTTESIFAPSGRFENVTAILGPPLASEVIDVEPTRSGDASTLTKLTYRLPLWPNLVFYLLGMPGLPVMHDFGFARSPSTSGATLHSPEELQPWSCLLDEVIASFGPPIQDGDVWAPYGKYKFQAHSPNGQDRPFWAVFSWNLLQHMEWAREVGE
jgi:hypothetical protein